MHPEAWSYLELAVGKLKFTPSKVVEFGSYDVNGTPRPLFQHACSAGIYTGIDVVAGPCVDVVCDAADWEPDGEDYEVAVSTEVFEHTARWMDIIGVASSALRDGGAFILTMATDPRAPHACTPDGEGMLPGEWYKNIRQEELVAWLHAYDFEVKDVRVHSRGDLYALALKRG